jgi:UV DNA damage repair endonuclease
MEAAMVTGAADAGRASAPPLGLCCQFAREPIRFRTTTATAMLRLTRSERLERLASLCMTNADALLAALGLCARNGIGAFRANSQVLPVKTHPLAGYAIDELPGTADTVARFRECGRFAREQLSFLPITHARRPDQPGVVTALRDLQSPTQSPDAVSPLLLFLTDHLVSHRGR